MDFCWFFSVLYRVCFVYCIKIVSLLFFRTSIQGSRNFFSIVPLWLFSNICSFVHFVSVWVAFCFSLPDQNANYYWFRFRGVLSGVARGRYAVKIRRNVASYLHILLIIRASYVCQSPNACLLRSWFAFEGFEKFSTFKPHTLRGPLCSKRIFNVFRSHACAYDWFFDVFIRRSLMDHRCKIFLWSLLRFCSFLSLFFSRSLCRSAVVFSFIPSFFILKCTEKEINCKQHSSRSIRITIRNITFFSRW